MFSLARRVAHGVLPRPLVTWLRDHLRPHVDEVAMVAALAQGRGVMVDVGAHHGSGTARFLDKGWSVVAYEPDPQNRAEFERNIGSSPRVQLSTCAVSDEEMVGAPLFASDLSTGISGLSAFHPSHVPTVSVDVVTLDRDLKRRGVEQVDFLKIDVEGFDFFVLRGFDWRLSPRFVLYEFENHKTTPLGYTLEDSAAYMAERGYALLYSVWEPIVEYGREHTWRGLYREPPADAAECWGNVLCFREAADLERCYARFN